MKYLPKRKNQISKHLDFCNPLELLIIRVQPLSIITKRFFSDFFFFQTEKTEIQLAWEEIRLTWGLKDGARSASCSELLPQ